MSETFAARMTEDAARMRLVVTVDGIDEAWTDARTLDASLFGRTTARTLLDAVETGEDRLDYDRRMVDGGSLRVELLDDEGDPLAALFAVQTRAATWLTADVTSGVDTLDVASTAALPSSGTVYVGGETITYTGTTPTTLTGCSRGVAGSPAQAHRGTTEQGAPVFLAPPAWIGRRVRLWGILLDDDGTSTSSLTQALGTWSMSSPPVQRDDGTWVIEARALAGELGERRLYLGLREAESAGGLTFDGETYTASCLAPELFTSGVLPTYVIAETDGRRPFLVGRLAEVDVDLQTVAFSREGLVWVSGTLRPSDTGSPQVQVQSLRHVALVGGATAQGILAALCSRLGDGANGSYDLLPGDDPVAFGGTAWRMGAGIFEEEVATSSFEAFATRTWQYVLDDVVSVVDILRDWSLFAAAFWRVTPSGQIEARPLGDERGDDAVGVIDDGMLLDSADVEVFVDEEGTAPVVLLRANYSPLTREHMRTLGLVDQDLLDRYPTRTAAVELQTRGAAVLPLLGEGGQIWSAGEAMTVAEAEDLVRRYQRTDERGRLMVRVRCHRAAVLVQVGDVVDVDLPAVRDREGGTLAGRVARVVSRRVDYDRGEVDLTLHVLESVLVVAPSAVVDSAAGAVLTLQDTSFGGDEATPARAFAIGWVVRYWHVSGGVWTSETRTVVDVTDTTIELDTAPTAVTDGEDWITIEDNDAVGTGESDFGFAPADFGYQVPDEGILADGTTTRWR